jgi:hypothetical protein
VHQNDVDISRECDQCTGHGFLAVIAAGEYLNIAGDIKLTELSTHIVDKIDGRCDDDEIDNPRCSQAANSVHEQRNATDFAKCLGSSGAETLTLARSGNECRSSHGCSPRIKIEVFA